MAKNPNFVATVEKVKELALPVVEREGCRLYSIDFIGGGKGKGRALRVFIEKSGGVSIDDCANVSRALNLILDVEDAMPGGSYNLEVSSPGLERQLTDKWHYEIVIGKLIYVTLSQQIKNKAWVKGILESVSDESITLQTEGEQFVVPFDSIQRAKTIFEVKKNEKK